MRNMGKINYGRLIVAALVAAVFYFIADGMIHGKVLAEAHKAAITGAGKEMREDPTSFVYFAAFDLGKALVVMLLYVTARSRFGPGVSTAIFAGVVGWFAIEVVPNLANLPFPFYPKSVYWEWMAITFVPMVVGAILGGWIYKEA